MPERKLRVRVAACSIGVQSSVYYPYPPVTDYHAAKGLTKTIMSCSTEHYGVRAAMWLCVMRAISKPAP